MLDCFSTHTFFSFELMLISFIFTLFDSVMLLCFLLAWWRRGKTTMGNGLLYVLSIFPFKKGHVARSSARNLSNALQRLWSLLHFAFNAYFNSCYLVIYTTLAL
jgi:hypothetical protein